MQFALMVLPDTAAAAAVSGRHVRSDVRVVPHASGRPWLLGRWSPDDCVVATAGTASVAVLGVCPVTEAELAKWAGELRTVADADRLACRLSGAFHLVASVNGEVRVQGSATGLRRVFHAMVDGVPVAADRADVFGAPVDEEMLTVRTVCGLLPPSLGERPLWRGVSALPPDHYLVLQADRVRQVRWWRPPTPGVGLREGAVRVREALAEAVRVRQCDTLGSDLSGGLDSTSLCFLAARQRPELLTFRWAEAEAANDDAVFSAVAAEQLTAANHLVVPQSELPACFAEPAATVDAEQPYPFMRTADRIRRSAAVLADNGVTRHLAGHGGDELFGDLPGYLSRLLRRRPPTAIKHVRGQLALHRWTLRPTLAALLRPGTASGWWAAQAEQLTGPPPPARFPPLDWGLGAVRASEWASGDAVATAREVLRRHAETAEPLDADLGQHQYLVTLRRGAAAYRQLARLFDDAGVALEMPFFDDRVIEAALAVRLPERATPYRYKPLLAEAMHGVLPEQIRTRATKGVFSQDVRAGLREHRDAIADLFADSALAARGLIDRDRVIAGLYAPYADFRPVFAVEDLIGCENWLRAAIRPTSPEGSRATTAS
ncbi:asparagine synthase-related protein [Kutzneria buriramensis]|uniref:asparagine synthase (glutamine-hydrolyzing) n=1 Tax=Kutzneria buriramensis TaxID=1045776 RepID=A0A3E0GW79_9PSEU|nr:asparagine synthase-related protein [Kutzneria buriramensis]REH29654.1 asparagine synthase (glutamine-hydrolysing) [Kutzneria buriramensis]